ncbi:MAG: hypothetical protein AABZ74_05595 [Cyanobacteriota bacterium]
MTIKIGNKVDINMFVAPDAGDAKPHLIDNDFANMTISVSLKGQSSKNVFKC